MQIALQTILQPCGTHQKPSDTCAMLAVLNTGRGVEMITKCSLIHSSNRTRKQGPDPTFGEQSIIPFSDLIANHRHRADNIDNPITTPITADRMLCTSQAGLSSFAFSDVNIAAISSVVRCDSIDLLLAGSSKFGGDPKCAMRSVSIGLGTERARSVIVQHRRPHHGDSRIEIVAYGLTVAVRVLQIASL